MSGQQQEVPVLIVTAGLASGAAVSGPDSREPVPAGEEDEG